ncbi:P-loop NTPase fold protein [Pseudomonas mosselii]|uniref:P-loop NTPase fold protein n=1 Tax=Pseudomonas mosselii TaxID=78327 RepID=UPI0009EC3BAC|nr:P-loop NTPase fold protein [Pseudomonas mosselii]MCL8302871.1 KAP family NTPase [Pseudomonas mosselii]MCL8342096.1 KAP family NTPase [Pseudomonas mosselii]MCU9530066.1 KAP family NTPase [Pseudomonas mosselii]MCU9537238.1 KAP family NTPase [Pseudomonas mosselii]MCU9543221.1 KAP family NTPase [Pseudomonas mosselii]
MSPNEHISESLKTYLESPPLEYAFLINGEWGSGKTHYIENFIKNYKSNELKLIRISLFSLSTTKEINEKIFESIHPLLSSKKVKIATKILKGALSFGFKIDLDSDGKPDGTVNAKLDKIEFLDKISPTDSNKDIVVIFDDIERSSIPLKDTLGYINELTETLNTKVILIANEKQFDDKEKELYIKFKEKVIGKTFEITQDANSILNELLESDLEKFHTPDSINLKEEIAQIYTIADYKNLRKLKQTISDFTNFLSKLDDKFLKHPIFYKHLLRTFFALSLELKAGKLTESELRDDSPFISNRDTKDIHKKYFKESPVLYSGKIWADFLCKGSLSTINESTAKLVYFIEPKNTANAAPTWVKLLNFDDLEDPEFEELIASLNQELSTPTECDPRIYLHKLSIAIYFSKHQLSNLSIPTIRKFAKRFIDEFKSSEEWQSIKLSDNIHNDGIGYIYLSAEDPDFIELRKTIVKQSKESFESGEKIRAENAAASIKETFKSATVAELAKLLNTENEYTPILARLSPEDFVNRLSTCDSKDLQAIKNIIGVRYRTNTTINGSTLSQILHEEHKFWAKTSELLSNLQLNKNSLKSHKLNLLNQNTIKSTLHSLSKTTQK